jgi:cation:H+ antiporter
MKSISILQSFLGKAIFKYALMLLSIALVSGGFIFYGFTWLPLNFVLWCSLIILSSIIIWRAGSFFSLAAKVVEEHYTIPQSVKAAVIDATASSFPEFAVAVIAVIILGNAEVGIATIVGSALYNVLMIPAAVGIVAVSPVFVSKEVIWRDNLVYISVVIVLLIVTILFPAEWGIGVALVFLAMYLGYILLLHYNFVKHKKQQNNIKKDVENQIEKEIIKEYSIQSVKTAFAWIIGMMLLMGVGSHVLVESSIALGDLLGIHKVVMAFVVIAAGTSMPDMVLSIISSKHGYYDAAISNVFGSNIFDICVCLGLPIIIELIISGHNTPVNLPQVSLLWLLLGSTIIAFICFRTNKYTLTRLKAWFLGFLYVIIVIYSLSFA